MRTAIALPISLFLVACSDPGPPGPRGDPGPAGATGPIADVAALRAEIETLKMKLASVQVAKVPHLIAKAGTPEEADLGVSLGGSCAWHESAGGEVCFSSLPEPLYFTDPQCSGDAFTQSPAMSSLRRRARDGRLYRVDGVPFDVPYVAALDPSDGKCNMEGGPRFQVSRAVFIGATAPSYAQSDLSIVLK